MTFRIRPARDEDLQALYEMAKLTGGGFTNLPPDRGSLKAKLDRSHAAAVQDLKCTIGKSKVTVDVIANTDIQLELWAAREKAAWFEDVFHRTLDFERA